MSTRPRQIIAMGGGGFSMEPDNPLLDDHVLAASGARSPRVCFLATASGDADGYLARFYQAFAGRAEPGHLGLFDRQVEDVEGFLCAQDVIYVGGGNTANMLAVWRVHGVDRALCAAYERGVVLAGVSAGAVCWFEAAVSDSFGPLRALRDGLGLLPGTCAPHYDGDPERRPTFARLLAEGLPAGYGIDDGAALHFADGALREVVASRPGARAYRVELGGETALPARTLG
ncbi:MAG TPA: peptidase E [Kofleriaceae bacterium]|nr:peptidase E [Kofleriaceae bacterium]